jgi:GT2 family glycosyltransferase
MSMCSLVRRTVLPIDSMSTFNFFDDWALWMQLASNGHVFRAVDEVLFEALVRPSGLSAQILENAHRRAVELANLRRAHANLIGCDEPVSVVIPATDCVDLTVECLWHLARYSGIPLRVVYVDNGSQSGTAARIAEYAQLFELPIEIIQNAKNRGFTRAVNQGIRASESSHVLCLNNDCFVGPQCVDRMYWQLTRGGRRVAAVGPLTGDQSDQSLRRSARRDQAGVPRDARIDYFDALRGARVVKGGQRGRNEERLAFFCTLLHRRALAECGLLDEKTKEFRSGLGADDEWCLRTRKHGWQVRLALDAFAVHLGSQTFQNLKIDRRGLQRQALNRLQRMQQTPIAGGR